MAWWTWSSQFRDSHYQCEIVMQLGMGLDSTMLNVVLTGGPLSRGDIKAFTLVPFYHCSLLISSNGFAPLSQSAKPFRFQMNYPSRTRTFSKTYFREKGQHRKDSVIFKGKYLRQMIRDGDRNTCYFHLSTPIRRKFNRMEMLQDATKSWLPDQGQTEAEVPWGHTSAQQRPYLISWDVITKPNKRGGGDLIHSTHRMCAPNACKGLVENIDILCKGMSHSMGNYKL
ncbi:hypothetical protein Cgig2_028296 [Carnegiea gigantea]|uniref:Uncharacterized protein n=1 Tax=Carnegiea gigantea TaxID=171969 RepID=A0A9Q1GSQ2_9CARY|nr:hypothetical protein Cgig2_028296 [Carnegiea gigantea]